MKRWSKEWCNLFVWVKRGAIAFIRDASVEHHAFSIASFSEVAPQYWQQFNYVCVFLKALNNPPKNRKKVATLSTTAIRTRWGLNKLPPLHLKEQEKKISIPYKKQNRKVSNLNLRGSLLIREPEQHLRLLFLMIIYTIQNLFPIPFSKKKIKMLFTQWPSGIWFLRYFTHKIAL